ncbi:MAG: type II toxin-antitoxin system VapC family toxin [Thermoproteales archaeon]|nr:type II toxin-antitoxin system VapC family toxin [Thermoproteales archaeon]
MTYVLDSSAIAIILKRLKERSIEVLDGNITLDLAAYELGNIIWKECTLRNLISSEDAASKAEQIARILEIIEQTKIESPQDFKDTMKLATKLKLTFYDASYLQAAKKMKTPLVTEDNELRKKAEKAGVKAITVNQLLNRLKKQSKTGSDITEAEETMEATGKMQLRR